MCRLYMVVKNDKYELPLFVSEKRREVARFINVTPNELSRLLSPSIRLRENKTSKKYKMYKLVIVDVEDDVLCV